MSPFSTLFARHAIVRDHERGNLTRRNVLQCGENLSAFQGIASGGVSRGVRVFIALQFPFRYLVPEASGEIPYFDSTAQGVAFANGSEVAVLLNT